MGNVLADCVEVVQVRIQIPAVGESADGGCPQLIVQAKKNLANGDVAQGDRTISHAPRSTWSR